MGIVKLLAAGAAIAAGAVQADSGVWLLEGEHNRVYLAGSIHLMKPDAATLPPALQRAYQDAERLVFELDLDDLDQTQVASAMMTSGLRSDGSSLSAALPPADARRLGAAANKFGLPTALLDRTEPWLASLLLTSASLVQQGYSPEAGIDQQLASRARQDRKPVTGLETPADQFAAFDTLPEPVQLQLLSQTLDELEDGTVDLERIEKAWRAGDQTQLARLLREEMGGVEDLEEALLTARNRRWIPHILRLLSGRDDALVVVGAAHLVGDDGVVALLRAAGRDVTPVR